MRKSQCLLFMLKRTYICYFLICITVPLIEQYKSIFLDYADGTSPKNCGNTCLEALSNLETAIDNLLDWFCHNNFKANLSKGHLLSPSNLKSINIKSSSIEGNSNEKSWSQI